MGYGSNPSRFSRVMSCQWRSHSSITGIINYHVLKLVVTLSTHNLPKDELAVVRKSEKERQFELAKLASRVLKLEHKKMNIFFHYCYW